MNWINTLSNDELLEAYNALKVQDALFDCVSMFLRPLTHDELIRWNAIDNSLITVEEEVEKRFGGFNYV